jgi:hypothetical protein
MLEMEEARFMSFFSWIIQSINKEYERRIKAASRVTEYGMHHGHGHGHADDQEHAPHDVQQHAPHRENEPEHEAEAEDSDEGTVISNLPPGSRLPSSETFPQ